MLAAFFKTLTRQLVMIASVILILVAVYVSLGRQFMPAVSGYREWVEERISAQFGIPVAIDSLTGSFSRFNPGIEIQGLQFGVLQSEGAVDDDRQGLEFNTARVELNVWQTLLQRQIVLRDFSVQGLDLTARYTSDGNWVLSGINLPGGGALDLDTAYNTIQRVAKLELNDVSIDLRLPNGGATRFEQIEGIIQNSAGSHYIHIDASMDGVEENILLSLELTGEGLGNIDGMVHVRLPEHDYSALTNGEQFGNLILGELAGGGHGWIAIEDGRFASATALPDLRRVGFAIGESDALEFSAVSGRLHAVRDAVDDSLEIMANDLTLNWNGRTWEQGDSYVLIEPERRLAMRAQVIDLTMIREVVLASGLAGQPLVEPLEAYVPEGIMRNLNLTLPLSETGVFELQGNMDNVAVDQVGGTPAMSGISGYLAIDFDFDRMLLNGMAEVNTENFAINIASLFEDTWQYDHVNGRVKFQFETGERYRVKVASGMIVAESPIVDGRASFSTTFMRQPDGERFSDFSLLVGASRLDGRMKSPYLPNAQGINPGLFRTMNWLDGALLDGAVSDSGVIFQGSLLRNQDRTRSSFQAFFNFEDGRVQYIDTWPQLSDVSGSVIVDNGGAAIQVDGGRSMGLNIGPTQAVIEEGENGRSWLDIQGTADGFTRDGLNFLVAAPLENVLGDLMTDWVADGQVDADVHLRVPLNAGADQPFVEIAASLIDNTLELPRYSLAFDNVDGLIDFNTEEGLHDSRLTAAVFGGTAEIQPESRRNESNEFVTTIQVSGNAQTGALAEWPGQSGFVRDVLGRTRGAMNYRADLTIRGAETRLQINSDLRGIAIDLPAPFGKAQDQSRPLNLTITSTGTANAIEGVIGSDLSMRVRMDGQGPTGIVYLGTIPGVANPWQSSADAPGLEVRGNLDVFNVAAWLEVLSGASLVAAPTQGLTNWLSSVQLDVATLDLFGQELQSVDVDVLYLDDTDYWTVALDSQAIAGSILLPFNRDDYIEAYLAYLHLPGGEEEEEEPVPDAAAEPATPPIGEVEEEAERIDVLAGLDPRQFPPVRFFAGEVTIGDRSYGLGQFTMNTGPDGAEFSDLIVDFRGFQVGRSEGDNPVFQWRYDGETHHSSLTGVITAADMADVLQANGFAPSMESSQARFDTRLDWPGSPAFFSAAGLNGEVVLDIQNGRFLQDSGGPGALKLISIINLNAIMRRLRFSDDLVRRGLAFDEITGDLILDNGVVAINDRLVISGPSSVFQVTGNVDLASQTIDGRMYVTLPVSDNIPWLGLLTGSLPLAIGAYLFDQIFGDQVNNLTSAQYRLQGPWEGLQPEFEQAFGAPPLRNNNSAGTPQPAGVSQN